MTPEEALKALLWELPAEFSEEPDYKKTRAQFSVFKKRNVHSVHEALWVLQQHFGEKKSKPYRGFDFPG